MYVRERKGDYMRRKGEATAIVTINVNKKGSTRTRKQD